MADPLPEPSADMAFYVGFTSGTTGLPKGFRRSHRSWLESFRLAEQAFAITADDIIMVPGSLQHSLHLFGAVHGLHLGAQTILTQDFRPGDTLMQINRHQPSILYVTPTQLHYLIRVAALNDRAFPSVRRILTSGAKWSGGDAAGIKRHFSAAQLIEFFGASETSFVTISPQESGAPIASVGRAAPGVAVEVRDDEDQGVSAGTIGRIWIKSALLFDGYEFGESGDTRWRDGWLTVGDRGWIDNEGYLYLAGRESRMIITSGVNVYPEEVERTLEAHPAISRAAVFGPRDAARGQVVIALFEVEGGAVPPDSTILRCWCRGHLGKEKVPRAFVQVEHWPLTSGGKTDLEKLRHQIPASAAKAEKGDGR